MMDCNVFVELVTDYLEGEMDAVERARFDEHIGICEGCEVYLEQFRQTIQITGKLSVADVPKPAEQKLLAAFKDWKKRRSGP